jgi:hypothetical protein
MSKTAVTRAKVELQMLTVCEDGEDIFLLRPGEDPNSSFLGCACATAQDKADLKEIARRCNVHDETIGALKLLQRLVGTSDPRGIADMRKIVSDALAKAEGRAEAPKPLTDDERRHMRWLEEGGRLLTRAQDDELRALHNRDAEASEAEAQS